MKQSKKQEMSAQEEAQWRKAQHAHRGEINTL